MHDSKTLSEVLAKAHEVRKSKIDLAVCDRGYCGASCVDGIAIILPKKPLKRDNRYQRDKKRNRCRQRPAIEPLIGHLKQLYRLSRNFFKGTLGDEINVLMATCAWNMKKWINQRLAAFLCALRQVHPPGFIALRPLRYVKWMMSLVINLRGYATSARH